MKIGFVSLGCPKNLVDGEVMLGMAQQAGHEITADANDAEVLVVNTCAFIDNAKEESVDAILEMAQLKRDGKAKRLIVTGCLAERYREQLKKEIPEIDACLGTGDVPEIVNAIESKPTNVRFFKSRKDAEGPREPGTLHPAPGTAPSHPGEGITYLYGSETPRLRTTPKHFAYVKIAEGCDYTCAFCIIPTLRGAYRSRSADSIVQEARALADEVGIEQVERLRGHGGFTALAGELRGLGEVEHIAQPRRAGLRAGAHDGQIQRALMGLGSALLPDGELWMHVLLFLERQAADVLRELQRQHRADTNAGERPYCGWHSRMVRRPGQRLAD